MSRIAPTTAGQLNYFVGNADGRGLIRLEADHTSPDAGEHVASMPRGAKSEANAARLVAGWNALEAANGIVKAFNEAMENQKDGPPDIKLMICANYGDLALSLLQKALRQGGK